MSNWHGLPLSTTIVLYNIVSKKLINLFIGPKSLDPPIKLWRLILFSLDPSNMKGSKVWKDFSELIDQLLNYNLD